jgi:exosortase/archaeosortase family protein
MLIFIAAIYCVQALKKQKWKAFFAIIPVIYVLNLIRNVGIIYMMDELGWSYDVAHNTVGKGGSFIALIILAFVAFKLLPELLDNIWGIIDLKDRQKKKEVSEKKEEGEPEKEVEEKELEEEEQGKVVKEEGLEKGEEPEEEEQGKLEKEKGLEKGEEPEDKEELEEGEGLIEEKQEEERG